MSFSSLSSVLCICCLAVVIGHIWNRSSAWIYNWVNWALNQRCISFSTEVFNSWICCCLPPVHMWKRDQRGMNLQAIQQWCFICTRHVQHNGMESNCWHYEQWALDSRYVIFNLRKHCQSVYRAQELVESKSCVQLWHLIEKCSHVVVGGGWGTVVCNLNNTRWILELFWGLALFDDVVFC